MMEMNGMGPPPPPAAGMGPPPPAAPGGESMLEARRAQIQAMPEGPAKDAAIAAYVKDYAGLGGVAEDQQSFGAKAALMPVAQGTQTGGKYGTFVGASPLEHMANGLRTYKGYKDMGEAKTAREELAMEKQAAMAALMKAGL